MPPMPLNICTNRGGLIHIRKYIMKATAASESLSYVTRQLNEVHDVIITLYTSITSDRVISIGMESSTGLFICAPKSIEELGKVYAKFARKHVIGKTLAKLDDEIIDLTHTVHTTAFEVNKICKGSIPKEIKDVK